MRLMDRLACASAAKDVTFGRDGRRFAVRGPAAQAAAIHACPLRYVLDDPVARLCESLLNTDVGMLDPANSFLRLHAENYWLEWFRDGSPPGPRSGPRSRQKLGCLIAAAADGRSGTLHSFWIDDADQAQAGQVCLVFDLDCRPTANTPDTRALNHRCAEFQPLLDQVIVQVEPDWREYFDALPPASQSEFIAECAERVWFDLPMALAFTALLDAGSYVASVPSNLGKLNRTRAACGRPALLDHIESRIDLGRQPA